MDYPINPIYTDNYIPIILSTDDNYIQYLSVTLVSIVRNASFDFKYDIIVLEIGVNDSNKERILKIAEGRNNISIRFFNMEKAIDGINLSTRTYYSNAIYFRLFAPYLMDSYSKAIYIDCDLVVNRDLSELYKIELNNNYLGAIRDIGTILHYYSKGKKYINPDYFNNQLASITIDDYFNSGVLLMNLQLIRKIPLNELLDACNKKGYLFPDQDGLNNLFKNKTIIIPMKWNVLPNNTGNRNTTNIQKDVPKYISEEYIKSRNDPYIIHYAMKEKPWKYNLDLDYPLMIKFWEYAKYSPFFKELLLNKKNSIQYFEKIKIINYLFPTDKVFSVKSSNNVFFEWKDILIFGISDLIVKYEVFDNRSYGFDIIISTILESENIDKYSFYFANEKGKKIATRLIQTPVKYSFNGKTIGRKYAYIGSFSNSNEIEEYRLFCKYDGLSIRITRINYSQNFPIDKLDKHQYYSDKNRILSLNESKIKIEPYSKKAYRRYEKQYLKELGNIDLKKILFRKIYPVIKWVYRKPIWIISCNEKAEDNGFAFFKYMQSNKNIRTYFLTRKESDETYKKVKKIGKVVKEGTIKHKILFYISDYSISSIVDNRLIKPFDVPCLRDIKANNRFIFLQHGVISQDLSREHNRFIYNPAGFITSTEDEYKSLLTGYYAYEPTNVWLTGLARHDYLYNSKQKIITIMPTWRKYLYPNLPEDSQFFIKYNSLINDEKLHDELKKRGYKLCLKLHPLMIEHSNKFVSNYSDTFEIYEKTYTDLYAESSLIITDYSSAIYDCIYLKKPIIYFQFDYDEFYSGKHAYDHGYLDYEKNGFGEVSYNQDELIAVIIYYLNNDCELHEPYKTRIESAFKYRDGMNCNRIYNKIMDDMLSRRRTKSINNSIMLRSNERRCLR